MATQFNPNLKALLEITCQSNDYRNAISIMRAAQPASTLDYKIIAAAANYFAAKPHLLSQEALTFFTATSCKMSRRSQQSTIQNACEDALKSGHRIQVMQTLNLYSDTASTIQDLSALANLAKQNHLTSREEVLTTKIKTLQKAIQTEKGKALIDILTKTPREDVLRALHTLLKDVGELSAEHITEAARIASKKRYTLVFQILNGHASDEARQAITPSPTSSSAPSAAETDGKAE